MQFHYQSQTTMKIIASCFELGGNKDETIIREIDENSLEILNDLPPWCAINVD